MSFFISGSISLRINKYLYQYLLRQLEKTKKKNHIRTELISFVSFELFCVSFSIELERSLQFWLQIVQLHNQCAHNIIPLKSTGGNP